jgi:putative OPT family oligopeptide transporter
VSAGPGAHEPFVPASRRISELTPRALALGCLLGIVFAASSVYLALKIGMTVSASIPIAVLSVTLLRALGRATILENNIVQTAGSAGESIAFAVATVPPALLLMGQELSAGMVMRVATLGGLLGILMMIPLRRGLIVAEHGRLTYPEGTACAEVLIAGERGGAGARLVFGGFGVGAAYKLACAGLRLFSEVPQRALAAYRGGSLACEVAPELLGVGYIIGPRIAGITVAGGVLSYLVLAPAIAFFGAGAAEPLFPAQQLIRDMGPQELRNSYILYIGAGAVTMGGLIGLLRALPTMAAALRSGLADLTRGLRLAPTSERTDRDIPLGLVVGGAALLAIALWRAPGLHLDLLGAALMLLFGFIFVTVSSRITGEIGSSSNPISGMTISALLLCCLIFLGLGLEGEWVRAAVISVGSVVCVAAANAGTTSQDLKTGFLVGATPWRQQVAIALGALTSALVVGYVLLFLNDAYTTVVPRSFDGVRLESAARGRRAGPDGREYEIRYLGTPRGDALPGEYLTEPDGTIRFLVDPGIGGVETRVGGHRVPKFDAPKARLMSLVVDGIMTRRLPWVLVLLGAFIALAVEACGVPSLPFAVGAYLPFSTTTALFAGGAVRWLVDRRAPPRAGAAAESSPGVMLASGYIAGGAITGVVLAAIAARGGSDALALGDALGPISRSGGVSLLAFALLAAWLYLRGTRRAVPDGEGGVAHTSLR